MQLEKLQVIPLIKHQSSKNSELIKSAANRFACCTLNPYNAKGLCSNMPSFILPVEEPSERCSE